MNQVVVKEQLINVMPPDLKLWIKERMPKTAVEAGELADQYMQARGAVRSTGSANVKQERRPVERRCHECKEVGHLARECPNKNKMSKGSDRRDPKEKRALICFNCHQRGHKATECPSNALCCEE